MISSSFQATGLISTSSVSVVHTCSSQLNLTNAFLHFFNLFPDTLFDNEGMCYLTVLLDQSPMSQHSDILRVLP